MPNTQIQELEEVTVTYQVTRTVKVRPPIYEGIVSLRLSQEIGLHEEAFEIVSFE